MSFGRSAGDITTAVLRKYGKPQESHVPARKRLVIESRKWRRGAEKLGPPDVAFRATSRRLQPQIDRIGRLMSKVFDDSSMLIGDRHNLLY